MPTIGPWNLALTQDEVLERLPLSSPAFTARPAGDLVAGILRSIESDGLIEPAASYEFHDLNGIHGQCLELGDGTALAADAPLTELDGADSILFAVWSLGPRISGAVSDAFAGGNYLRGLVLDEIASLLLFRLGERLFDQLEHEMAGETVNIGKAVAPGDGVLGLSTQGTVLFLAGAGLIDVECGAAGSMTPFKSASALAPVGSSVRRPRHRWSCEDCRTRQTCRLRPCRLRQGDGNLHGRLH